MKSQNISFLISALLLLALCFSSCEDPVCEEDCCDDNCPDDTAWVYNPTYFIPEVPSNFPSIEDVTPADNPFTRQGVKLGRMLFYDPILSADSTLACAGCHSQSAAFTDSDRFSVGIDGIEGKRNSMPLFNLAWQSSFFWDGRAPTIEVQVTMPVEDPIEMHDTWPNVVTKLKRHPDYPLLFFQAFGVEPDSISKEYAAKALSQFIRTMISGNSPFDKTIRNEATGLLSQDAEDGAIIYGQNVSGTGDCNHCHLTISDPFFQDRNEFGQFRNNGLDSAAVPTDFDDGGRAKVTSSYFDNGKFKVPSLRNIALTAPYMHDGRFATLKEVLDFYSEGVNAGPFTDGSMEFAHQGGVQLSEADKLKIIAFLESLTDDEFINNPDFSNPFE